MANWSHESWQVDLMRIDQVAIDLVRTDLMTWKVDLHIGVQKKNNHPPGREITISEGAVYCATIYYIMQKEKVDQCNHCLQQYQLQGRQY